ncbi:MAG: hypothetical protein MUF05_03020 [Candidatus Omnitrophica bacterium]|jgi:hypothetical protein|nr:hypothetical protein [Candidatus Omnitrophota bacterium]
MNPKISIISSAHRPQNWMNLHKSIGDNQIDFELVFVGPNPPSFNLPRNFRFIKSLVKPTQCLEIAFRSTMSDLVMCMADDCIFKTPKPLDVLYEKYQSYHSDKIIVSCRYMMDGEEQPSSCSHFFANDINSPIVPLSGLMSRKLWIKVGGIDRNFIGIMWDLDIAMRVHALGGSVILSDVFLDEDKGKRTAGSALCEEFWRHDRGLLEDLWVKNGKVNFNRANPVVESFHDLNILTESQGPRGRWRGKGPVVLEKIEDNLPRLVRGIKKPKMYFNYAKRIFLAIKGK